MTAPAYISTLGSAIEAKQPERTMLEQHTQEFLNQGRKIEVLPPTAFSPEQSYMYGPADSYTMGTTELI